MSAKTVVALSIAAAFTLLPALENTFAQAPPAVEYYRLVPGFIAESFNDDGMARGSGFAAPNPWGQYTAYLLATNGKGQRTWRIENYLPNQNGQSAQGSSMYLFEGNARALLVDTAQNTQDAPGQDLKSVVRHLLGHANDGSAKSNPVDFAVSNTHSHGDHTGKNSIMSDRTVYYPDLDWPRTPPANYVPIKEGGGATNNGAKEAVGSIDLGARTIDAVRLYAHTPGSTGYLDRENKMVATGDAIGSAYVWAHFGLMTQYADSVHHLQEVLRPFDRVDVLPAHFYQVKQGARGKAPINGRPLDKRYVDDQVRVADGILAGTVVGEPYRSVGRNAAIATIDSAGVVYTLANLYPGGVHASTGDRSKYHAIVIPGSNAPAVAAGGRFAAVDGIKSTIHLIRDYANQTLYLISGSSKALLIGTGSGTPGVAAFVKGLAGALPVEVLVTSDDPGQVGGLQEFAGATVYAARGMTLPAAINNMKFVTSGDRIDLGMDRAGRPLVLEIQRLTGHSAHGLTLLDASNRVLWSGDALGAQDADAGLILRDPLATFADALAKWRASTDGRYDVVYTAHNLQWITAAAFVDEVQAAVRKGLSEGDAAFTASMRMPGVKMIKSAGNNEVVASIVLPN